MKDLEQAHCQKLHDDIMVLKEGVNLLNQRLDSLDTKYSKLEIRVREIEAKLDMQADT